MSEDVLILERDELYEAVWSEPAQKLAAKYFISGPALAACTTALIDRLVHHSEIISVEGESYRKREAELTKDATETRRRKKRSCP